MKDGLAHIGSNRALLGLLTLGFVPMLVGMPYQTLLPVFAESVYGVGAAGLGIMSAAGGIGALAGSLSLAVVARSKGSGSLQLALGLGFGLSLVGLGAAPSFPVALFFLVLIGFTFAGYAALNQTLVMERADPQYHGRVTSVYLMSFGFLPLATFPEAWAADHFGAPAVVAGAGVLVALTVVLSLLVPSYRRLG